MTVHAKLIKKIFLNQQISYQEAERILLGLGYKLKIRGSHHVFRKPNHTLINIKKRAQLLTYQINDLQEVLIEHGYQKES